MSGKLKVLLTQATTLVGGDTIIHSLIMRGLNPATVDVAVACNYGDRHNTAPTYKYVEAVPGIQLRPTFFGSNNNYRSVTGALKTTFVDGPLIGLGIADTVRYIRRNRIQVVHFIERSRDAGIGLLVARAGGAKAVVHVHSMVNDWYTPLAKAAVRYADARIAVSKFVMNSIITKGYPKKNTFTVHNGLNIEQWSEQIDGSAIRNEFGVEPATPLLLMVARMSYWKGPGELLKALAKVRETQPRFKALLVGDEDLTAPHGQSRTLEDLRAMARSLNLEQQVIFTGRRQDIKEFMAAADIYVMPTVDDPFPTVFMEAQAMGLPIAALRSGGTPELVEDGKAGLLAEPYNNEQLASNLITLIENPDLRAHMGANGRRRVEEYLNVGRMGRDIEAIYRQVLSADVSRRAARATTL